MSHCTELSRSYVQGFCSLYASGDPLLRKQARSSLVSTAISCLSFCEVEDRSIIIEGIMMMSAAIMKVRFEDGQDLIDFLKEEFPLRGQNDKIGEESSE